MAALILLALVLLIVLAVLAMAGYLLKIISLLIILAGVTLLMFVAYTSLLVAGISFVGLHQLGGNELLPYSILLSLGIGLSVAISSAQEDWEGNTCLHAQNGTQDQ